MATGFNFLHGTNSTVGDFQMSGSAVVHLNYQERGEDHIEMDVNYQWNDVMDPNHKYTSDTIKSAYAEMSTLGRATPYKLSIRWRAACRVIVGQSVRRVRVWGYPGKNCL